MSERYTVADGSWLKLRTRARGFLARLAHDLELDATLIEGEGTRDGDAFDGVLRVAIDGIRLVGVIEKGGSVNPDTLSDADRHEVERKIRKEVFRGEPEVLVEIRRSDVRVRFGERITTVRPTLQQKETDDAFEIHATCSVSMRALGLMEVKGPLGAFAVKDDVEVEANLIVRRAP
jgi:hypothetical protein